MALRCLIVDDSEEFLASAQSLLSVQGLEVVGVASSAHDALRVAAEQQPDVALVDVQLGEEDGLELARQLDRRVPTMSVVLISVHSADDLSELLAGSPAVGFLNKTMLSVPAVTSLLANAPRDR